MFIISTWVITIICLAGTILNIKKNVICFWLWSFGNIAWLIFDCTAGLYSRAVLDAVQLGFAIWGIVAWSKKQPV